MVCVPCFIVPVLLIIWRFIIRPIFVKFFGFGVKKDSEGNKVEPEFPFECKGNVCPFPVGKKKEQKPESTEGQEVTAAVDDKKEN